MFCESRVVQTEYSARHLKLQSFSRKEIKVTVQKRFFIKITVSTCAFAVF